MADRTLRQDITGRKYLFTPELAARKDMQLYIDGEQVRNPYNTIQHTPPDERLSAIDAQLLVAENRKVRAELEQMRTEYTSGRGDDKLLQERDVLKQQVSELQEELARLRGQAQSAPKSDNSDISLFDI